MDIARTYNVSFATIHILKSPIMEPGMLKKAEDSLKRLAGKTVEKQAETGVGNAASEAARQLWNSSRASSELNAALAAAPPESDPNKAVDAINRRASHNS
jgi:hypothetical protein